MELNEILVTVGSILLSLTITFLFNYFIALPKKIKTTREQEKKVINNLSSRIDEQQHTIDELKNAVDQLPKYREQNRIIQEKLKQADVEILDVCNKIKDEVIENRNEVIGKLIRLETREKNALRAKIVDEYRLYTNEKKNPMLAWTEMEHHSFFQLVEDYESLGGNDYVHKTIIPAMHKLDVISMDQLAKIKELYDSRKI